MVILGGKMKIKKVIEVEIELDYDQVDKIIIESLEWHVDNAENEDDIEALEKVLFYYRGGLK